MKYFIGVDQGGSKTEILIGDENGILIDKCTGSGYGVLLTELKDNSEFYNKYIEQQIRYLSNLLNNNSLVLSDVYALTACMATVNSVDIQVSLENDLRNRISVPNITIYHDMYGAWRAGTDKLPSGVMGVGTGTGILFFDENGTATNLTGNIKHQAALELGYRGFLHACFSAMKILEPTILTESICEFAQTSTIDEALMKTKNGQDINALSHQFFVPYIYDAVLQKDRVAEDFVNEVGSGLAECIRSGIKNLGWENREVSLVLSGGSFKGKGFVLEKVIKDHLRDLTKLTLFQAEYEPVYGALMLTYEKYNNGIIPQITDQDIVRLQLKRELL
ncbi:MAG: gspK [Herbinix sp.]|jgi:N-acetylglucosamine kinase-like BadF-type ATPase|nr:gspK [Herbinix sp.]